MGEINLLPERLKRPPDRPEESWWLPLSCAIILILGFTLMWSPWMKDQRVARITKQMDAKLERVVGIQHRKDDIQNQGIDRLNSHYHKGLKREIMFDD